MLKVAVIGAGVGRTVHIPALLRTKKFEIAGIVSKNTTNSFSTFSSIDLLLKKKIIDIFLIATPPFTHLEITKKIIALRKPIYFEKPFCVNLKDAKILNSLINKYKLMHCVGYQFRYEEGLQKLNFLIKNKKIGKISNIKIDWLTKKKEQKKSWKNFDKYGAGVEYNYLPHCIDYLMWITNFKKFKIKSYKTDSSVNSKYNRELNLILNLDDHLNVSINICNNLKKSIGHNIKVSGEKGVLDLFWKYPFNVESTSLESIVNGEKKTEDINKVDNLDTRILAVQDLWENFYEMINGTKVIDIPTSNNAIKIHKYIKKIKEFV